MDDQLRREITKRAAEVYDLALDAGKHFDCADLAADLTVRLRKAKLGTQRQLLDVLLADAAQTAIAKVDGQRRLPDPQASLITLMDQAVAVSEGRRIARKAMKLVDWTERLAHVGSNAARVNSAAAKENARFTALASYLGDGLSTEAAVAAWQVANPEGTLP